MFTPISCGNDAGQGGLAQARGAVEQHMVQRLSPAAGRLDENGQILLGLLLADVFRAGCGGAGTASPLSSGRKLLETRGSS